VEAQMTPDGSDLRTALHKATDAVHSATETVQTTTESIAGAIENSRQPGGFLDQLVTLTRKAPLGSLAVAFLAGVMFARRR
jgi:hypothetical protein